MHYRAISIVYVSNTAKNNRCVKMCLKFPFSIYYDSKLYESIKVYSFQQEYTKNKATCGVKTRVITSA